MRRAYLLPAVILLLPVVGAALGWHVGGQVVAGRFEQWYSLGQPPEPAVSVVVVPEGALILAASGQWYLRAASATCSETAPCWVPAGPPTAEPEQREPHSVDECTIEMPALRGVSAAAARCNTEPLYQWLVVYAVRLDGSVWAWSHGRDFEMGPLLTLLATTAAGLVIGLIVMVALVAVLAVRQLWRARR